MKTYQFFLLGFATIGVCVFLFSFVLIKNFDYKIKAGKVYYRKFNNMTYKLELREMPEADATSFQKLGYGYGKDHEYVYWQGNILKGASPASFRILNGPLYLCRDAEAIFYHRSVLSNDPEHFEILRRDIYKDSQYLYHGSKVVPGVHVATFHFLDENKYYARDKYRLYYNTQPIEGAELSTFEYMAEAYAKDHQQVYFRGKVIPTAQPASFEVLNHQYGKDAERVFYEEKILDGADVKTFHLFKNKRGFTLGKDRFGEYEFGTRRPSTVR